MLTRITEKIDWTNAVYTLAIMALTIIILSVLILSVGVNPLTAYYYLIIGAFGNLSSVINTINKAVPICFAGFAVAVATKAGIFNIGVEGQLVFGAVGSVMAGMYLKGLPAFVHVPVALMAGMLFGMLYALLPTVLFVKRGSNLLVLFIMLNNVVKLLNTYFINGPLAGDNLMLAATNKIQESAKLPYLIRTPNRLTIGILIVLAMAIVLWFYFNKTTSGYNLRAVGGNRSAAGYSGLNVSRYLGGALLAGGALAGLAGGVEVLGNYHRLYDGFSPGYGFDGIPIAMLAGGNPFGVIIGSILFGALRVGSVNMQVKAGVSIEIVSVFQGVLVVLFSMQYIFRFVFDKWSSRRQERLGFGKEGEVKA